MSPPLKRFKFEDATTVTLKVGPGQKIFYPHKELLCKASPFFQAALRGNFIEARKKVIKLPDDNVQAVEDFLQWMYSGQAEHPERSLLETIETAKTEYERFVQLYGFAEKVSCTGLKRCLINNLFVACVAFTDQRKTFGPNMECIHQAYDLAPKKSALRRLFVAFAVFSIVDEKWWENEANGSYLAAFPEYAAELAIAFATIGKRSNPFKTGTARQFYDPDMIEEEDHHENSEGIDSILKPKKAPKAPKAPKQPTT